MIIEAWHDDVAALHQPNRGRRIGVNDRARDLRDPGAGGIDQRARPDFVPHAGRLVAGADGPDAVRTIGRDAGGARRDRRTPVGRIAGVQHDEARILDPAIGIGEAQGVDRLQRIAGRVGAQP